MAGISREPKISLTLTIDEEKNKVVLAEAGRDFVEVLLSFLTLPMGTIVRLTEKVITIGCFINLYKSVADMEIDDFVTEACKQKLVYPRSVEDAWCRTLKLNINPTEASKFFVCSSLSLTSCRMCSNFSTSLCSCGRLMNEEIRCLGADQVTGGIQNDVDGLFTSFIITDDLKLTVNSTSSLLQTLQDLGYCDFGKLRERALDVGLEEVVTLLQCVFSSNAPLTDTFLKNQSSHKVRKIYGTTTSSSSRLEKKNGDEAGPEKVITFDAIVRKQDMKIMFVECDHDFVDLQMRAFKCVLPYYYSCAKKLLNIDTPKPPEVIYSSNRCLRYLNTLSDLEMMSLDAPFYDPKITFVDPKSDRSYSAKDGMESLAKKLYDKVGFFIKDGFVKPERKFTVSDDLIVTPKKSSSNLSLFEEVEE